jgi:hypothetical protein
MVSTDSIPHISTPAAPGWSKPMFAQAFLGTWLGIIGFVAIVNFVVNPFGIYPTTLIPRVETNNYEKKLELFDAFQPQPEALILGSSRVMSLDPEIVTGITGQRCFNFSLPGAKTETYYAVLKLALDRGAPIKTVIVGVEPEVFNPVLPIQSEARYIDDYSKYFVYDKHGQASVWEKISLLVTLDQINESISSLTRILEGKTGAQKLEYQPNGYSVQTEREAEIAAGTFDLIARIQSRVRKYPERSMALSKFTGLSDRRKQYWQAFLDLCKEKGIRVIVFMPPDHPELLTLLKSLGAEKIIDEVESYLQTTIAAEGGDFHNFTDISSFNGDPNLFYDEIHTQPSNGVRILEKLLISNGDSGGQIP